MMTVKFCSKCHKEAYRVKQEGDSIKIVQNGRTLLSMSNNSSGNISFSCPAGHPVPLKLGEPVKQEAT